MPALEVATPARAKTQEAKMGSQTFRVWRRKDKKGDVSQTWSIPLAWESAFFVPVLEQPQIQVLLYFWKWTTSFPSPVGVEGLNVCRGLTPILVHVFVL